MEKTILKIVAMLLLAAVPLMSHADGGTISYTATYDFNQLTIGTRILGNTTYSTVHYYGMQNWGQPGAPSLPVDCILFSVPSNADNFTVTVSTVTDSVQVLDKQLYPCQSIHSDTITMPDNSLYNSGNPYPELLAWVVDDGMLAGENHIVTVAVMPISYENAADARGYGNLRMRGSLNLTLNYNLKEIPEIQPLIPKNNTLHEQGIELAQRLVVNPDDVRDNAASARLDRLQELPDRLDPNDPVGDPETYLIVTTQPMQHSLRRLAALQSQKGVNVRIVTVSEAVNDPHAGPGDIVVYGGDSILTYTDDAGKLRQFLKNQFENMGTKNVLFAGSDVPSRNESDSYFSCLDFDWMVDKDYFPELFVGRILASSNRQINNYIDKLLRYELNPGHGDYSYLGRSLIIEGPGHENNSMYMTPKLPTPYITIVTHDYDTEFTGNDLLDLISANHYGFMAAYNDGWTTGINLYRDSDDETRYFLWAIDTVKVGANAAYDQETNNGLNRMQNKCHPMIYLSPIGKTMPFTTMGGSGTVVNYGESYTTGKDYGGPVYMGYTGEVDEAAAYEMAEHFAACLASSHYKLNEAQTLGKFMLIDPDYRDTEPMLFNYLGDPTLEMWSDTPQQYSNITLTRSDDGITVSGISANETIIAYCDNDGNVGSCTSSQSSVTIDDISPNSTVMLYRHNWIPFVAPLIIQNTAIAHSQYVIATDVIAGKAVDSARTQGNVIVEDGVEYEIEASGRILLSSGFKVEKGATFAVRKSSY